MNLDLVFKGMYEIIKNVDLILKHVRSRLRKTECSRVLLVVKNNSERL